MRKKWIILHFLSIVLLTNISFGENHSKNINLDTKEEGGKVIENSIPIKTPPGEGSTIGEIIHFWQNHGDGFMELFTKEEADHEKENRVNK